MLFPNPFCVESFNNKILSKTTTSNQPHKIIEMDDCFPGWIKASQTFMTLSLIFLAGSTFLLFLYMFHKQFDQDRRLIAISMVLTFLAGTMNHIHI